MDDYALVLNAGSSSLKFCVFRRLGRGPWHQDARGLVEGLRASPRLTVKDSQGEKLTDETLPNSVSDGAAALDVVAGWLRSQYGGAHVVGVGHRVVHGGPRYNKPVIVTRDVLQELSKLIPLAPLHQPYNLVPIQAVLDRMPHVPQVACFDTSFHRSQPKVATLVPLPRDLCRTGIERYGFHGISYDYIASILPDIAPEIAKGRVIVAHLGSGASLCALSNGKSIDTTMSFTALDGLCMGTRPGALDPGVVLYLVQARSMTAAQVEDVLYKKSGLLGISGVSPDMRDLLARNDADSRLAVEYFVYQASKQIGALAAVLGGLDAIVFTAGIGENSPEIRRRICQVSQWLGLELDETANAANATRISTAVSKTSAWVIPTNEELMIARHTCSLLGLE